MTDSSFPLPFKNRKLKRKCSFIDNSISINTIYSGVEIVTMVTKPGFPSICNACCLRVINMSIIVIVSFCCQFDINLLPPKKRTLNQRISSIRLAYDHVCGGIFLVANGCRRAQTVRIRSTSITSFFPAHFVHPSQPQICCPSVLSCHFKNGI